MKIPYFDAHCDTALPVYMAGKSLNSNPFHLDLKRLSEHAPAAQVFSICAEHRAGMTKETEFVLAELLRQMGNHSDKLLLCRKAEDIAKAEAEGKIAAFISIEGAEKLDCSLEKLRCAYDKGLRILHLCWNHPNELTGSCWSGQGLSEKGREFVAAAQEMGVALDMSHISERAFWDTLEIAKKPVLAGHSNSAAVCAHPRNLTDEQFVALAKMGGVAGLNFCAPFLREEDADIESIVDHAEHFLSLGGERAVCLGTDFDGAPLPKGITGVQDMHKLYEAMLRRNWSEELVRDIFYNNLKRYMEAVL